MPKNKSKDRTFVADLVRSRGGDADGLRVDHFAHHAAGTIRGAHEDGAQVQLLRGDFLQTAEERVRRSVAAGQRDAEPADKGSEERKEPAGTRESQSQDRVHAGVARDVT